MCLFYFTYTATVLGTFNISDGAKQDISGKHVFWRLGPLRNKVISSHGFGYTVKPVCNDHLYNKMYYLWFIQ